MILITGANGHLGRQTIEFLIKKGIEPSQITALVRSIEKGEDLALKGVKIAIGDYDDQESLVKAFKGIDKILLVSGSDLKNRLAQHERILKAAKEANVKHVIYTSGARVSDSPDSLLWLFMEAHIKTEELLKSSGLTYTILRNGLYLDIIPLFIGDVLNTEMIYLPTGQGRVAMALRSEMAEAAAEVLTSGGHENKQYNLVNIETYSFKEVAEYISKITGKSIQYISPSKEEFTSTLLEAGIDMPEEYLYILLALSEGEGDFTSNDLTRLLGRDPLSLNEFLLNEYRL